MKPTKIFLTSFLFLLGLSLLSCGSSTADRQAAIEDSLRLDSLLKDSLLKDSLLRAEQDSIARAEAQARQDTIAREFLEHLYNKYVFGGEDLANIKKFFSQSVLKRLRDGYDYECYDGDCYAVWLFRTDAQDGYGASSVKEITRDEEGWYVVSYKDMGLAGTTKFQLEFSDDIPTVVDFKRVR